MRWYILFSALLATAVAGTLTANPDQTALTLIEQTGVRGGFIVTSGVERVS